MIYVNIAKDFSPVPGGRYPQNGPHDAMTFWDTVLRSALTRADNTYQDVQVSFEGLSGCPAVFLNEAFCRAGREFPYVSIRFVSGIDPLTAPYVLLAKRYHDEARVKAKQLVE